MLVFWSERLVFLAVPKTGTTAIEGALAPRASLVLRDPPILKHSPVYRYRRFIQPLLKKGADVEFETLAVIRNPIDWLDSWYRYRHRDDLEGHPNSTRGVSFDDFVDEYAKGKPAPFAAVGSQAKFVCGDSGQILVDHLFQYEQQDKLIAFLEDRLSTVIDLNRLNVSPKVDTTLSERTEAKLRRKCAAEFDVWEAARR
ncbi:gamma-glutamyl kinase [Loktanella sp. IMCC34160]|uniref:sulfotransferase family 2 domain-containing protein n=1 Tax=Loktanella sp. IMCC34160 TaxID=2510646 RepID=UPI00101B9B31|nr:sulfotransferase family 2 domain-containing protein [Loktanella sp. IMCC34160]RYG92249.1 gamma-glutamyl kinase [Loktanella sp. IMCC34160]